MGELIRDLSDNDRPLCPATFAGPMDPRHEIHNRTLDAFSDAATKNDDGEMLPEVDKAYYNAAYSRMSPRMYLYRDAVSLIDRASGFFTVEAYYFMCPICGLILPANRVYR